MCPRLSLLCLSLRLVELVTHHPSRFVTLWHARDMQKCGSSFLNQACLLNDATPPNFSICWSGLDITITDGNAAHDNDNAAVLGGHAWLLGTQWKRCEQDGSTGG